LLFAQRQSRVYGLHAPPILDYPTSQWREGQLLESVALLPYSADIQRIGVGLYRTDGTRLTVTDENGAPIRENIVRLPLLPSQCVVD
jgi:hypothetical protein